MATARKRRGTPPDSPVVGWREWVSLPEIGIDRIKAKIDTGARSSALHAIGVEKFERGDLTWVRFYVQPMQRRVRPRVKVETPLYDERWVRNSGGGRELRAVILTDLHVGSLVWPIELTLTDRAVMGFRFLLGRQALRQRAVIDPGRSYVIGKEKRRKRRKKTSRKKKTGSRTKKASPKKNAKPARRKKKKTGKSSSRGTKTTHEKKPREEA